MSIIEKNYLICLININGINFQVSKILPVRLKAQILSEQLRDRRFHKCNLTDSFMQNSISFSMNLSSLTMELIWYKWYEKHSYVSKEGSCILMWMPSDCSRRDKNIYKELPATHNSSQNNTIDFKGKGTRGTVQHTSSMSVDSDRMLSAADMISSEWTVGTLSFNRSRFTCTGK